MEAQSKLLSLFFFQILWNVLPYFNKIKILNILYGRVKRYFSFQENCRPLLLICSNPISLGQKRVRIYVCNCILMALNIGYWLKNTKIHRVILQKCTLHLSTPLRYFTELKILKNCHFTFILLAVRSVVKIPFSLCVILTCLRIFLSD